MIVSKSGYGILLTEDFGEPFSGYEELVEAIKKLKNENYDEPEWVVSCPSAEDYQFILGFWMKISKNHDFNAADEEFKKLLEILPDNIKAILAKIKLPEPDMHFMYGHC